MANGSNGFIVWTLSGLSGLLVLITTIGGYTMSREYNRNDDQGQRIRLLEQSQERNSVTLKYISEDISEVKEDMKVVKGLLQKP